MYKTTSRVLGVVLLILAALTGIIISAQDDVCDTRYATSSACGDIALTQTIVATDFVTDEAFSVSYPAGWLAEDIDGIVNIANNATAFEQINQFPSVLVKGDLILNALLVPEADIFESPLSVLEAVVQDNRDIDDVEFLGQPEAIDINGVSAAYVRSTASATDFEITTDTPFYTTLIATQLSFGYAITVGVHDGSFEAEIRAIAGSVAPLEPDMPPLTSIDLSETVTFVDPLGEDFVISANYPAGWVVDETTSSIGNTQAVLDANQSDFNAPIPTNDTVLTIIAFTPEIMELFILDGDSTPGNVIRTLGDLIFEGIETDLSEPQVIMIGDNNAAIALVTIVDGVPSLGTFIVIETAPDTYAVLVSRYGDDSNGDSITRAIAETVRIEGADAMQNNNDVPDSDETTTDEVSVTDDEPETPIATETWEQFTIDYRLEGFTFTFSHPADWAYNPASETFGTSREFIEEAEIGNALFAGGNFFLEMIPISPVVADYLAIDIESTASEILFSASRFDFFYPSYDFSDPVSYTIDGFDAAYVTATRSFHDGDRKIASVIVSGPENTYMILTLVYGRDYDGFNILLNIAESATLEPLFEGATSGIDLSREFITIIDELEVTLDHPIAWDVDEETLSFANSRTVLRRATNLDTTLANFTDDDVAIQVVLYRATENSLPSDAIAFTLENLPDASIDALDFSETRLREINGNAGAIASGTITNSNDDTYNMTVVAVQTAPDMVAVVVARYGDDVAGQAYTIAMVSSVSVAEVEDIFNTSYALELTNAFSTTLNDDTTLAFDYPSLWALDEDPIILANSDDVLARMGNIANALYLTDDEISVQFVPYGATMRETFARQDDHLPTGAIEYVVGNYFFATYTDLSLAPIRHLGIRNNDDAAYTIGTLTNSNNDTYNIAVMSLQADADTIIVLIGLYGDEIEGYNVLYRIAETVQTE